MSNKEIIEKVFSEEFNQKKMKQQILLKYERKKKKKMNKFMKYAIVPICLVLVAFIGISLTDKNVLEESGIGAMKVYAYTMSKDETLEKTELKENVKLGLASYNLAMSSVPGYPIVFELDNIDSINIDVTEGSIFDWNRSTGEVKSLGSMYQLSGDGTLYFNINIRTNIKVTGIKNNQEVFEKNIIISSDDDFNYYATIK